MSMNKHVLLSALAAASLSSLASAQLGRQTIEIDLEGQSLDIAHLGVVHLNGLFYSSARGNGVTTTAPHTVYVYDPLGTIIPVLEFSQSALANASAWGYRDGCSDGNSLIFGHEGGIEVIDTTGLPVATVLAANGPQPVVTPLLGGGGITTYRALAFDANGNSGNGSLFVGDFAADVEEIALDGSLLHTYTNTDNWSFYGLALDTTNGTLWGNSTPNAGDITEYAIDRVANTLTPTGRSFSRGQPAGIQGGLDYVPGGLDGRNCGADLIGLDQGAPDAAYGYRVEQWDGLAQPNEPTLQVGYDGGNLSSDVVQVPLSATTIEVAPASMIPGLPGIICLDLANGAPRPAGPLAGINAIWELTFPRPGFVTAGITTGLPLSIPYVPGILPLEWQAMVFEPALLTGQCGVALPLMSTNVVRHEPAPQFAFQVCAEGANSFNADTASGFFKVIAGPLATTDPVVSVEFDWVLSSDPAQATMVFDCDQIGMANTFMEGNGGGCGGTYRNGSDVASGLDYTNIANNLLDVATCAGSLAHCEATNPTTAPSYRTLKWYFAGGTFLSGVTFEFDADTDGGAGITGAAMSGMVVTIELASGAILTGELAVDPAGVNRAVITF